MADNRRQFDESPRRHEREWPDRMRDDRHSWFDDRSSRYESERGLSDDRGSRWEGASDDRAYGTYRTDDRGYHDRYRDGYRDNADRYRDRDDAANEYYRAARDQRADYMRWSAQNMGVWGDQTPTSESEHMPSWLRRERGGYWRQYESNRPHFAGRGPKGYKRSDDRIREEICDCMTDDPMLDASDIEVEVTEGEVTLSGGVTSRDQKRRAEDIAERIGGVRDVTNQLRVSRDAGHSWASDSSRAVGQGTTSSRLVSEASGKGTPSKSTSGTTA
jgi:osmotically-inducible protein OsmY